MITDIDERGVIAKLRQALGDNERELMVS
jgi:hypothetical protein